MERKRIVEQGYDQIAERYADWAAHVWSDERARYTDLIVRSLPDRAEVLELGCASGGPTTQALAGRFKLIGVDLSARNVELARANVPGTTFLHADMTELEIEPASFDAVVAFFSIIHVPREEQQGLLAKIARWLRPDGLFVATMGAGSTEDGYEEDWLGAPMYWSHFDAATNQGLVEEAGLVIESATLETADEDGAPVTFLWVVARKPGVQREPA
ncbi:MAG TPA: methyltransferase domain-containing protein [Ktedonobacterales bacterium]|jgi:SAM-dependent methyltransferase|nr:methyltransferase domain-containing protein [Ktedonobacterales bacterium]